MGQGAFFLLLFFFSTQGRKLTGVKFVTFVIVIENSKVHNYSGFTHEGIVRLLLEAVGKIFKLTNGECLNSSNSELFFDYYFTLQVFVSNTPVID